MRVEVIDGLFDRVATVTESGQVSVYDDKVRFEVDYKENLCIIYFDKGEGDEK